MMSVFGSNIKRSKHILLMEQNLKNEEKMRDSTKKIELNKKKFKPFSGDEDLLLFLIKFEQFVCVHFEQQHKEELFHPLK